MCYFYLLLFFFWFFFGFLCYFTHFYIDKFVTLIKFIDNTDGITSFHFVSNVYCWWLFSFVRSLFILLSWTWHLQGNKNKMWQTLDFAVCYVWVCVCFLFANTKKKQLNSGNSFEHSTNKPRQLEPIDNLSWQLNPKEKWISVWKLFHFKFEKVPEHFSLIFTLNFYLFSIEFLIPSTIFNHSIFPIVV